SPTEHVFINISQETWAREDFFNPWVKQIHRLSQIFPGRIVVEVSEKVDVAFIRRRWADIRSANVLLALDDYDDQHTQANVLSRFDWDFCKFNLSRVSSFEDLTAIEYCRRHGIYSV